MLTILKDLDLLIANRKKNLPEGAYTTSLFNSGLDRILRKIGEESGEVIIAAKNHDPIEISNEAADLIFHIMVMLHQEGLSLESVSQILKDRHLKK